MLKKVAEGVQITLHVLPNAPKSEMVGLYNGALKLKIKAPPVDGKANKEIIHFFSALFNISKHNCEILKGDKSKSKKILVHGLTLEAVQSHLPQSSNS